MKKSKTQIQLYLVFEFLFMDLKKYIDDQRKQNTRIDVGLTQSYMFQMLQVILDLQIQLNS